MHNATEIDTEAFVREHGGHPVPAGHHAQRILDDPMRKWVWLRDQPLKLPRPAGGDQGVPERLLLPDGAVLTANTTSIEGHSWRHHQPPGDEVYRTAVQLLYVELVIDRMEADFHLIRRAEMGWVGQDGLRPKVQWRRAYGPDPRDPKGRLLALKGLIQKKRTDLAALQASYEALPAVKQARAREALDRRNAQREAMEASHRQSEIEGITLHDPAPSRPLPSDLRQPINTSKID